MSFFTKASIFLFKSQKNKSQIISVNRVLLQLNLFWIPKWALGLSIISCLVSLCLVVPQMAYLFTSPNIQDLIESACPFVACILTSVKQILCTFKKEKLRKLLASLQYEWDEHYKSDDSEIHRILSKTDKFCHILTICYSIWFMVVCIIYSSFPIGEYLFYAIILRKFPANYVMEFPYKVIFFWDYKDGYNFHITYFVILLAVFVLGFSLSGFDTLFITLTCHVSTQFKLLNQRILNLNKLLTEKNEDYLMSELRSCIIRHNACIRLTYELEECFNVYLLLQFVCSSIILCIVSFQMMIDFGLNRNTTQLFGYLMGSFLQLYVFCWIAEKLKNDTHEIADSLYQIQWYIGSIRFQKSVNLILMRSQKPLGVTAAKFYIISLESFQKIIITSYSYFTLLETIYD